MFFFNYKLFKMVEKFIWLAQSGNVPYLKYVNVDFKSLCNPALGQGFYDSALLIKIQVTSNSSNSYDRLNSEDITATSVVKNILK